MRGGHVIREPDLRHRQRSEAVRILLIEDDPVFADLVQTQLRRMRGVESRLEVLGSLAEARERLSRAPFEFDLVVTDLGLPASAGPATAEALARTGEQPLIVLTADAT